MGPQPQIILTLIPQISSQKTTNNPNEDQPSQSTHLFQVLIEDKRSVRLCSNGAFMAYKTSFNNTLVQTRSTPREKYCVDCLFYFYDMLAYSLQTNIQIDTRIQFDVCKLNFQLQIHPCLNMSNTCKFVRLNRTNYPNATTNYQEVHT